MIFACVPAKMLKCCFICSKKMFCSKIIRINFFNFLYCIHYLWCTPLRWATKWGVSCQPLRNSMSHAAQNKVCKKSITSCRLAFTTGKHNVQYIFKLSSWPRWRVKVIEQFLTKWLFFFFFLTACFSVCSRIIRIQSRDPRIKTLASWCPTPQSVHTELPSGGCSMN